VGLGTLACTCSPVIGGQCTGELAGGAGYSPGLSHSGFGWVRGGLFMFMGAVVIDMVLGSTWMWGACGCHQTHPGLAR